MSTNQIEEHDPEDMFKDTRMSFGDHIEDLRAHLLRAIKGFVLGMIIGIWPLGSWVLGIIVSPVEEQLNQFEKKKLDAEIKKAHKKMETLGLRFPAIRHPVEFDKNELLEELGFKPKEPPLLDATVKAYENLLVELDIAYLLDEDVRKQSGLIRLKSFRIPDPLFYVTEVQRIQQTVTRKSLTTLEITEAFMVYFKVAALTGFVISSPWVFYHVWMFIAAGLYPNEKKLVNIYLPFSLFLFICGILICQFAVMPRAVEALLWFNEWLGLSADLRLNTWLGFALMMPLVFGISFQTPLVMMFLHKVGILEVQTFRDYRKISWFVMAVFAALITPSVDAFSMLFLWVPMGALYELGIILCVWQGKQEALAEWEIEEKNEMVEV